MTEEISNRKKFEPLGNRDPFIGDIDRTHFVKADNKAPSSSTKGNNESNLEKTIVRGGESSSVVIDNNIERILRILEKKLAIFGKEKSIADCVTEILHGLLPENSQIVDRVKTQISIKYPDWLETGPDFKPLLESDLMSERSYSQSTLPKQAPALWSKNKEPGDTPPVFIQRHYAPWLGNGLGRAEIRQLDPKLYTALANWLRHHDLPPGLELPTLKERTDRWIDRLQVTSPPRDERFPTEAPSSTQHARRLVRALERREKSSQNR